MAIKLNKTDEKGVITRYHRLVGFIVTSTSIVAEIESYVNDKKREECEKTGEPTYYQRLAITLDYNGTDKLCFECVYERLLQTEHFNGGEKI